MNVHSHKPPLSSQSKRKRTAKVNTERSWRKILMEGYLKKYKHQGAMRIFSHYTKRWFCLTTTHFAYAKEDDPENKHLGYKKVHKVTVSLGVHSLCRKY